PQPDKAAEQITVQLKTVSGRITDENGEPLEGVTVALKETTTSTLTDADGNYRIDLPEGRHILVFSIVGFEPKEEEVGNQSTLDIMLNAFVSDLDEVVVVGYGTARKKDLTGAVTQVAAEKLE